MSTKPKPKRFLTNRRGEKVSVVLGIEDYRKILADLEELDSIRAYDAAKTAGADVVPFSQATEEIERARK